jgi:hypothetical protein
MTYLTRATLVRDAVERAALNARPAPIPHERNHSPNALTRFARARLGLHTAMRELSERRRDRASYRALTRRLATYTTQTDVDDLLATIEGKADADAEMIRSILAGNLLQQRTHQLAAFSPPAGGGE